MDGRNESIAVRFEFADRVHDIDTIRFRRRRRHRVDKSRPGRHSRPADAGICRLDPPVDISVGMDPLGNADRAPHRVAPPPSPRFPPPRHARNKSIAVRFNFGGSGVWLGYPRVSGASVRSRLGSRDARTARPCPPAVTPDLIRGPGLPRAAIWGNRARAVPVALDPGSSPG